MERLTEYTEHNASLSKLVRSYPAFKPKVLHHNIKYNIRVIITKWLKVIKPNENCIMKIGLHIQFSLD